MSLPTIVAIVVALFFGALAAYFSIKEEKTKKLLRVSEVEHTQRTYQLEVLKQIQERIGYELDIEKISDVIRASLSNLFPFSTSSSLVVKDTKLIFKTRVEESVNNAFITQVKNTMLASLVALQGATQEHTQHIEESKTGAIVSDSNSLPVGSFFNIPLIVNEEVVGLINISSTKPGLYKENQMTLLYQIVTLASSAVSKLEKVLTTEKGKLMATIASLADGVFMIDTNSNLLVINQSAKTFLRVPSQNPSMADVLASFGNTYDVATNLATVMHTKTIIEAKEVAIFDKLFHMTIQPVADDATKNVLGASVLLQDITLEKNLAKLKEDFTSMMVHELRAPLTAIKGSSGLIMSQTSALTPDEQKKLLTIIHEQSERLIEDISLLLDAAKLEAGRFTIIKKPSVIRDIIQERIDFFAAQATKKHITVVLDIPSTLPNANIDPLRIGQVLNNLLSNSLKFTPDNGKITIKAEEVKETKASLPPVSLLKILITDTGIGIPKEKQSLLFSKFSQVLSNNSAFPHPVVTPDGTTSGTGLGLYISKGIVEAHGGEISLESEPNKGTTISFTLPLNS